MSAVIRVLVVDDSALMRELIGDALRAAPGIDVVGTASNGAKALELVASLQPDVVTLDIQMPGMDGLETLDAILAQRPVPVIMVSALTQRGADVTLDALDRGAVDYVAKPDGMADLDAAWKENLHRKIRTMAGADVRRLLAIRKQRAEQARRAPLPMPAAAASTGDVAALANKCIAIGISTGGPPALSTLFGALRLPLPPIVVVQHMPPDFTRALAWRLNANSQLTVKEAETGDVLRPNHAYLAPGGKHLHLRRDGGDVKCWIRDGEPVSSHKPSVDVMMKSAAEVFRADCLGVVMTGMGRDGADGCKAIRAAGGYVLGQDEASSDVYGMNKVAFVEGGVDRQFPLDEGAAVIMQHVKRKWQPAPALVPAGARG